eukprot:COSAG02_NODE_28311_length_592_cov_0.580122_1_plen_62_part_00
MADFRGLAHVSVYPCECKRNIYTRRDRSATVTSTEKATRQDKARAYVVASDEDEFNHVVSV